MSCSTTALHYSRDVGIYLRNFKRMYVGVLVYIKSNFTILSWDKPPILPVFQRGERFDDILPFMHNISYFYSVLLSLKLFDSIDFLICLNYTWCHEIGLPNLTGAVLKMMVKNLINIICKIGFYLFPKVLKIIK